MQHRGYGPATRERERFERGRSGVPRVLTALFLFFAMLGGTFGTGRGAQCARHHIVPVSTTHRQAVSSGGLHRAAPDRQAPAQDGGVPSPSQGCTPAIALPVIAMIPPTSVPAQAPPLERLVALVAMHEPPTLFRPPRVI